MNCKYGFWLLKPGSFYSNQILYVRAGSVIHTKTALWLHRQPQYSVRDKWICESGRNTTIRSDLHFEWKYFGFDGVPKEWVKIE